MLKVKKLFRMEIWSLKLHNTEHNQGALSTHSKSSKLSGNDLREPTFMFKWLNFRKKKFANQVKIVNRMCLEARIFLLMGNFYFLLLSWLACSREVLLNTLWAKWIFDHIKSIEWMWNGRTSFALMSFTWNYFCI